MISVILGGVSGMVVGVAFLLWRTSFNILHQRIARAVVFGKSAVIVVSASITALVGQYHEAKLFLGFAIIAAGLMALFTKYYESGMHSHGLGLVTDWEEDLVVDHELCPECFSQLHLEQSGRIAQIGSCLNPGCGASFEIQTGSCNLVQRIRESRAVTAGEEAAVA